MTLVLVLVALLAGSEDSVPLVPQTRSPVATGSMQDDVARLVHEAGKLTGMWPSQPPPPVPEVVVVARHGRSVVPLLVTLLSDDPNAERDRPRWKVQQQAALALCRIYSESQHCGRTYCDGDPPARIAGVKGGWLRVIASDAEMRALSGRELLDRFRQEKVFWRQAEIGAALAGAGNRETITGLEAWLTHDDRHLRGNVALVLGRLGDPRGFDTIEAILADRSSRSRGQGIPGGNWTVRAQVGADRYYAVHLLGDLKDPRGVDLLIPLLDDEEVDEIVAWALAEIGDPRAIAPLIKETEKDDPSVRVLAISALERLNARDALPRLRDLLQDTRRSNFGTQTTVAEAARHAIAVILPLP
jgi:HEAT repeat protein